MRNIDTAIIDYGVGNLFSLKSSFAYVGENACVSSDPEELIQAKRLILPGVGAFEDAARKLNETGLGAFVRERAAAGIPLMGICLGMQLLFDRSYEFGEHTGLGLIPGVVRSIRDVINPELKVPHIGWNALHFLRGGCPILKNVPDGSYVYFVHSFYAAECLEHTVAVTDYSADLTAIVQKDNVFGCQFHPEKSGDIGLEILRAFCREVG